MSDLNSSNHQPLELSKFLGMSRAVPPWQLGDGMFYDVLNYRLRRGRCEQFPRKIKTGSTIDSVPLLSILLLPQFGLTSNQAVVLSGNKVLRVSSSTSTVNITNGVTISGSTSNRFSTVLFEDRFYATNLDTPVFWTDGASTGRFNTETQPCGRFIEVFFDHLVVANCSDDPRKVRWSNLRKFGSWTNNRNSEADFFQFLEGEDEAIGGITGLKRLNDLLVVYTPSQIWIGRYVGLPKVIVFERIASTLSNDCFYGLLAVDKVHLFPSFRWRNFFAFGGTTPEPIGDDIADFFFEDVSTSEDDQQATWAYFDKRNQEAVWVYKSRTNTGTYDKAVVLNLQTKKWYRCSAEKITCFSEKLLSGKTIDQLTGAIDGLTGTIDGLAAVTSRLDAIWGTSEGYFLREATSEDADTAVEPIEMPFVETGDLLSQNLNETKETDGVTLHVAFGSAEGFEYRVAKKMNVLEDATFVKSIANLLSTTVENRLTHKKVNGKTLRFKVQPQARTLVHSPTPFFEADFSGDVVAAGLTETERWTYLPTGDVPRQGAVQNEGSGNFFRAFAPYPYPNTWKYSFLSKFQVPSGKAMRAYCTLPQNHGIPTYQYTVKLVASRDFSATPVWSETFVADGAQHGDSIGDVAYFITKIPTQATALYVIIVIDISNLASSSPILESSGYFGLNRFQLADYTTVPSRTKIALIAPTILTNGADR